MEAWQAGVVSAIIILLLERLFDFLRDKRKRKEQKEDKQEDKKEAEEHMQKEQENRILSAISELRGELKTVQLDLDGVRQEIKQVKSEAEEGRVLERRVRILRFADEVTHGMKHSKDHFQQLMEDGKVYKAYVEKHKDFTNGITEPAIQLIEDTYYARLKKNDFI